MQEGEKMSRRKGDQKWTAAMRKGPVQPGSLLHRILKRIAREVADALESLSPSDSAFTLFGAFGGPMAKPPAGE
jgi:hypothetical protein